MSKSNDEQRIEVEASEWFALLSDGNASEEDRKNFERWRAQDIRHRKAYDQFGRIWEELLQVDTSAMLREPAIIAGAGSRRDARRWWQKLAGPLRPKPWLGFGAAASLAIAVSVLVGLWAPAPTGEIHQTSVSEIRQAVLSDGSKITLSARSLVTVSYAKGMRRVELQHGQAFFDVVKDPQRPFVAVAGRTVTKVVGTRFDLWMGQGDVRVRVVEGSVDVGLADGRPPLRLRAGQQVAAISAPKGTLSLSEIEEVDTTALSSWLDGRLTYRNADLKEVVSDANRFYPGSIHLSDQALGNLKVTTAFNADQVEQMTQMLAAILPVSVYKQTDDQIIIVPAY